ncbi:DUF448 domain-containing protein [Sphingomonas radiodurans]|uniref:DUF448 domain-containing protein n=1 Tax=Sphingomonas radiodurans TaxID=2890321 RepID=UPI001E418E0F|nr:DUF448 domain-containing protein [Sphingomonas radiodurans]WBH17960.1 DUF448 domain-containing protein [Sphingomonas radiodurans]
MTERSCILTRAAAPPANLVRLVLAPDGRILPDVRAKAPGRGAWIGVTAAELAVAQKKGKLRGALARAFKTGDLQIPDDLPALVAAALERNALDRLGLESRAGMLLTGSERIADAARAGKLHALYHAADASEDGCRRLAQAWRVGSDQEGSDLRGLVLPIARPILSVALGRENVVHIGVTDRLAAGRLGEALDRWRYFIGPDLLGSHQSSALAGGVISASCATAAQGASAPGLSGHEPAVTTHEEFE